MNTASFISGAACMTVLSVLCLIVRDEVRAWQIRRRHEIRRRYGRTILHRI